MAMSSYLIKSNYVDPKFPPCEEYSQSNYIPEPGPEFYSQSRESEFAHHGNVYPGTGRFLAEPCPCDAESAALDCRGLAGHGLEPSPVPPSLTLHTRHVPCESEPACADTGYVGRDATCKEQQRPVVYPWMKRVHVNGGTSVLSRPHGPFCDSSAPRSESRRTYSAHACELFISTIYADLKGAAVSPKQNLWVLGNMVLGPVARSVRFHKGTFFT